MFNDFFALPVWTDQAAMYNFILNCVTVVLVVYWLRQVAHHIERQNRISTQKMAVVQENTLTIKALAKLAEQRAATTERVAENTARVMDQVKAVVSSGSGSAGDSGKLRTVNPPPV
jgi:hypothetical protein